MAEASEQVFIYGTLRSGCCNAFRMVGGRWVRGGKVRGQLYRIDSYPALVADAEAGTWVKGELWEVPGELLEVLDVYENEATAGDDDAEFRRTRVKVYEEMLEPDRLPSDEAWAWAWFGRMEDAEVVESGDWLDVEMPSKPPFFTGLGCLSLVAVPMGSAMMMAMLIRFFGNPDSLLWGGLGFVLAGVLPPVIAFGLSRFGDLQRERWMPLRGITEALAVIWMFAGGVGLLIALSSLLAGLF